MPFCARDYAVFGIEDLLRKSSLAGARPVVWYRNVKNAMSVCGRDCSWPTRLSE